MKAVEVLPQLKAQMVGFEQATTKNTLKIGKNTS